jgi:hypothetical protein
MAENDLAQYLGAVSPIPGPGAGGRGGAHDDCGGSELSFRPDAHGADASSRPPLGRVEVREGMRAPAALSAAPSVAV